jgi:hypothetical protein
MQSDPLEQENIAQEHPEIVEKMKKDYETWFKDVTSQRNFKLPSRIFHRRATREPSTVDTAGLAWAEGRLETHKPRSLGS